MLTICDTFQTFPSFIYLIPVMMLFGVTDTSVLIAIVIYATVPATRYTIQGLLSVPTTLQEAGSMAGVNRIQRYLSIELPLAFPHLALGVNQTVVFALSMVIIGALIGTDDRISATELDWLRQRIGQCWTVPAGARDAPAATRRLLPARPRPGPATRAASAPGPAMNPAACGRWRRCAP